MGRKTQKLPCPNPLFERLLKEWRDEAHEKGSKLQHVYAKALLSIQKYPIPLQSGQEAMILEGIGESIAKKLDEALAHHPPSHQPSYGISESEVLEVEQHVHSSQTRSSSNTATCTSASSSRKKKTQTGPNEYIPAYRTGAYALLLTLYKDNQRANTKGFMSKGELQREAQSLSDKSFTLPDPGSRYTAWSSMSTLTKKGLVVKTSSPAKYSITLEGCYLAEKIQKSAADQQAPSSSSSAINFSIGAGGSSSMSCNSSNTQTCSSAINFSIGAGSSSSMSCNSSNTQTCSVGDHGSYHDTVQDPPYPSLSLKQLVSEKASSSIYTSVVEKPKQSARPLIDVEKKPLTVTSTASSGQAISSEFVLKQGTFDVILCVDVIETTGGAHKSRKDTLAQELNNNGVQYDVRKLQVGDFAWVARDKTRPDRELVLDYIVERKRMDDLNHSIIDGRFREQKFRMKNCGLQHPIYLVENFGSAQHLSLPEATLQQAIVNTQVVDGFFIKRTKDIKESVAYLTLMTRFLQSSYMGKTLMACPRETLIELNTAPLSSDVISRDVNLMTFQEFNKEAVKNKVVSVREMFGKHLMQISGMSADKAVAILECYPTPRRLFEDYDRQPTTDYKERMLATLKYGNAKKSFGPALSKVVYQVYCTKDWPS